MFTLENRKTAFEINFRPGRLFVLDEDLGTSVPTHSHEFESGVRWKKPMEKDSEFKKE